VPRKLPGFERYRQEKIEKKARKVRTPFKGGFCLNRGEIAIKTTINVKTTELIRSSSQGRFRKSRVGTQKLAME
jgi:hypothetical protein